MDVTPELVEHIVDLSRLELGPEEVRGIAAELKRVLVDRGQKIILLADHTKFNKVAFVRVLDFAKLDMVITDQKPSSDWIEMFKEKGIELLYPQENIQPFMA